MLNFLLCFIIGALSAETIFHANPEQSILRWEGSKVTGKHYGTVKLKEGFLVANEKGEFSRGRFVIDMNTIFVEDIQDPKDNAKLTNHLKDSDFFDVSKHRYSTLEVRRISKKNENVYELSGDLEIKGIKQPVSFDAKITVDQQELKGEADITLDRTLWNVRYGSGKFFENLGNRLIYDDFNVKVKLVAQKD
ncbi:MAG: YceI family protein [Deltaproteobacteria bacterium]|nr:YceI family protein [Deltaproteobacteria bacterium]